jgi:ribosome biogenesis GTPase A
MPNLDPWINQYNNDYEDTATKTVSKFENHILSIRAERQNMIHPSSHPTYNERQQKIIEMIDWVLEKYKTVTNIQNMNEQVIIDNIIEEAI